MEDTEDMMECTMLMLSIKFATLFLNKVASNGCPVANGNILLHYMQSGKKKPHCMASQSFLTRFQKVLDAAKLVDCCYEKELDDKEAKILFFIHSLKNKFRINVPLTMTPSKISRTSFKGILMLIHPRKPIAPVIAVTAGAMPPVAIVFVTTMTCCLPNPVCLHHAPRNVHMINLTPLNAMTPIRCVLVTNSGSAKTAQLNGQNTLCIIQQLVLKPQKTLIPCASPQKQQNLGILHHLQNTCLCRHAAIVLLTHLIIQMAGSIPPSKAAHVVAPVGVPAVVIDRMMVVAAHVPLVLAMTIILDIMIFLSPNHCIRHWQTLQWPFPVGATPQWDRKLRFYQAADSTYFEYYLGYVVDGNNTNKHLPCRSSNDNNVPPMLTDQKGHNYSDPFNPTDPDYYIDDDDNHSYIGKNHKI